MATMQTEVQITFRWWVPVYLYTLAFLCVLMGTQPDMNKVTRVCLRGMRVQVWH